MASGAARRGRMALWVMLLLLHTTLSAAWTTSGYGEVVACPTDSTGACLTEELQVKLAGLVETDKTRTSAVSSALDFANSTDFDFGPETDDGGSSPIVSRSYSAPISRDNSPSGPSNAISDAHFSCVVSEYPIDVDPVTYPAGSIKIEYNIKGWMAAYADDRLELSLYVNQLIDGTASPPLSSEYKTDTLRVHVSSEAFVELPMTIPDTAGGPPVPVNVSLKAELLQISLPATEMVSYSFLFVRYPLSTILDSPYLAPFSRTWSSTATGDINTCLAPVDEHCPGGFTVNLALDRLEERGAGGIATRNEVAGFSGSPAFAFTDTESVDLLAADGVTYRTMTWWSFMAAIPQYGGATSPYAPVPDLSNGDPTFSCKVIEYSEDLNMIDFPAGSLEITCSVSGWSFLDAANRLVLTMSVTVTSDAAATGPEALYTDLSPDLVRLHLGSPEAFLDFQQKAYDDQTLVELDATAKVVSVSEGNAQVEVSLPDASDQSYTFMLVRPPLSLKGTFNGTGSGSFSGGTTWTPTWVTDPYQSGSVNTWFEPVDVGNWDHANISLSFVNVWEVTDADRFTPVTSVLDFSAGPYAYAPAATWDIVSGDGISMSTVGSRSIYASTPNDGVTPPYGADELSGDPQMTWTVTDYPSDLDVLNYPAGSLAFEYTFQNWTFQDLTSNWLVFHFAISVDTTYELALTESETASVLRVQLSVESFLDLPKHGIDLETGQQVEAQVHSLNKEARYTQMRVLLPASSSGLFYQFTLARPPLSFESTMSGAGTESFSGGTTWTPTWVTDPYDHGTVSTCFEPVGGQCMNYNDITWSLVNLEEVAADKVSPVATVLGFSEGPYVFGSDYTWDVLAADGTTMSTIGSQEFEAMIPNNGTATPYPYDGSTGDPWMRCSVSDYLPDLNFVYTPGSLSLKCYFENWQLQDEASNWLAFTFSISVSPTYELALAKSITEGGLRVELGDTSFLNLPWSAYDETLGEQVNPQVSLLDQSNDYAQVRVLLPVTDGTASYEFFIVRPPHSFNGVANSGSYSMGDLPMTTLMSMWWPGGGGSVFTCLYLLDYECAGGIVSLYLDSLVERGPYGIVSSVKDLNQSSAFEFGEVIPLSVRGDDVSTTSTILSRAFSAGIPQDEITEPFALYMGENNPYPTFTCTVEEFPATLDPDQFPAGLMTFSYTFENWVFNDSETNSLAFTFGFNTDAYIGLEETENMLLLYLDTDVRLELPKSYHDVEDNSTRSTEVHIVSHDPNDHVKVQVNLPASSIMRYTFRLVRRSLASPTRAPTPPSVDPESPPRSELHFFPGGFELCSAADCSPGVNSMLSLTLDRLGVGNQLVGSKSSLSSSSSFSEAVGMDFLMEISDFKTVDDLLFTRDPVYIDKEDPYHLLLLQIPRAGGQVVVYDDLESFQEPPERANSVHMVLGVTHVQSNESVTSEETNGMEIDAPKGSAKMKLFLRNAGNGTAFSDDTETFSFFLSGFQRGAMLAHVNVVEKENATRIAISSDTDVAANALEEVYIECPNHANVDGIPTRVKEVDAVVYSSGEYAGLIQFWIRVPGIQTSMEFEYQCVLVATDSSATSAVGASRSDSGSDAWEPPTTSRDGRSRSTKMQIGSRGEFGLCFDPSCAEGSPAVSVGFSGLGSRLGTKLPRFEGAAAFAFRDPTHVTDGETERWSTSFQAIVPQSRLQAPRAFTDGSSPPAKGEGTLFSVSVDQYLTPGQASNGDQLVDVPRGGLKFAVNISGWEFGGLDDALELNFTLSAASLFPNSSSDSGDKLHISQEDVATGANLTRVWLSDNTQAFLDVPLLAEVDGVMTHVNVSVSVDEENMGVIFAMTFPSFAETLYYDPVLASQALVKQDLKVTYVNHRRKRGSQFQLSQTAAIPLFVALVLVAAASVLHCFQTTPLSVEFPKEKP